MEGVLAVSETMEIISLLLVFVVHLVGAVCLVWAMAGDDGFRGLKDWWPRDDRPEGAVCLVGARAGAAGSRGLKDWCPRATRPEGDGPDPEPVAPAGGLPLPAGAEPSTVRLREPGRIADVKPRPARRPEHVPAPA